MLKPDRVEGRQDISWNFNMVAERGGIASIATTGSGGYPGEAKNAATYAANPSGQAPLGVLLYDVVSYDTNRQHDNWYKSGFVARSGMKVAIDPRGEYSTNMIPAGVTPSGGQAAYLAASGMISNVQATGAPKVGTFLSTPDADGYVRFRGLIS